MAATPASLSISQFSRADRLIVIARPRWLCLWRMLWRSAFQRRGQRRDLPDGCPERFDWDLLRHTWRWPIDRLPRMQAERLKHGARVPVIRLDSNRAVAELVEACG